MNDLHTRGQMLWLTEAMVCEHCCNCGMPFYMPKSFQQRKLDNKGEQFHCPAGHPQHYTGKNKDEQIAALQREAAHEREMRLSASQQATQHWKTSRQILGKLRKLKTRIGAGVCPCCQRTFSQLARHIKCKHPQYGGAQEAERTA